MSHTARAARIGDAPAITAIYNEGIADRIATFETEPRTTEQIARWFDGRHPIVVVEDDGAARGGVRILLGLSQSGMLRWCRGVFGLCRARPPWHRRGSCCHRGTYRCGDRGGTLEAGVSHISGERGEPHSDGAHGISRGRGVSATRQTRRRMARLRHRRAAAWRSALSAGRSQVCQSA